MTDFEHERLDVYRAAIEWLVIADELATRLPRGRAFLAAQLRRAATSVRVVAMLTAMVLRLGGAESGSGSGSGSNL